MSDNIENQKKEEWMEWVWPGFHWYQGNNAMYAYIEDMPKMGYEFSEMAVTYSKGTEAYYFILKEYEINGAKFFEEVKKDSCRLIEALNKVKFYSEEIFKFGQKYVTTDFTKFSDDDLLKVHRELFELDSPLWRYGQIPNLIELHNSFLSDYVKSIISEQFGESRLTEVFRIFTTSTYDTYTERQNMDFLLLLGKSNRDISSEDIFRHWEKYTWMTFGWAGPSLDLNYFLNNFKKAIQDNEYFENINNSIKFKKNTLFEQQNLLRELKDENKKWVLLLREILEQKARRVDAHSLTYFIAEKIMTEIGIRVGLSMDHMRVVLPEKVPALFKKFSMSEINDDCSRVLFWYENKKLLKFNELEAESKLKYISDRLPKVVETSEFKGAVAYQGKVQGLVSVILDIKEASKFNSGEILVTRMTDPSYVGLMKNSSAIITDIGGITCHASIVSRELRKPCIIGTKIATKVLKDGDLVEVNANEGIVKILNKS